MLRLLPLFSEEPSGGDSSDPMHGGDCLADQLQISVMALGFKSSTKCWKKQLFGSPKNQPISTRVHPSTVKYVTFRDWLSSDAS